MQPTTTSRVTRSLFAAASLTLLVATTPAWASHQPRFTQSAVEADSDVTLDLEVPEAGPEHNPEGRQDHHTEQVDVTVPDAFEIVGCGPPDGWECTRSGAVVRFSRGNRLTSVSTDDATYELYLRAPSENATHAFRTIQIYNDGHETRFTAAAGTAPTIDVVGGTSPTPEDTPSEEPAASPSPSAPTTSPSPAEPTERESPTAPATVASSPAPSPDPATPTRSPSPTPRASPSPTPSTTSAAPTPSQRPAPADDASRPPDDDALAAPASGDAPSGNLLRAAWCLLLVGAGWAVVEHRERRGPRGA